ncbi:hypothetical protein EJP77_05655 [Paenibacillus zeisoli]|uniref:Uncharacterized protein n=1 Tax=Paenibacillus zeisoli TaxID=2496267 RepID=A0A433XQY9_9BACL|nr:hypothetical protein [Paenibacillus zeisoli]RUT36456.1 hypothetical protein EJP77_05655 [Paenibacillus zeisoli]
MKRTFRKTILYGLLLVAGATIGIQLADTAPANMAAGTGMVTAQQYIQQGGTALSANSLQPNQGQGSTVQGSVVQGGVVQGNPQQSVQGVGSGNLNNPNAAGYQAQNGQYIQSGQPQQFIQQQVQTQDTSGVLQTPGNILLPASPKTPIDHFADRTGELLQQASQNGIKWVVSLFGSLTN